MADVRLDERCQFGATSTSRIASAVLGSCSVLPYMDFLTKIVRQYGEITVCSSCAADSDGECFTDAEASPGEESVQN